MLMIPEQPYSAHTPVALLPCHACNQTTSGSSDIPQPGMRMASLRSAPRSRLGCLFCFVESASLISACYFRWAASDVTAFDVACVFDGRTHDRLNKTQVQELSHL